MTNDVNQTTLHEWWQQVLFSGKELFRLEDNGRLVLKSINKQPERIVATLTDINADAAINALINKFPEVETKLTELEAEWVAAEDKLKLAGKVERLKEYLLHTNAAGDFGKLLQVVQDWEHTLQTLSDDNYNAKLRLVEQAEVLADSDKWKETSQAFRDLAEQWKHTGYLDKVRNDALWNRLEEAKAKFFERKRRNHEEFERDMLQNLDLKMELVDKAEHLAASENWKETSESFRQLMEQWKATGRTLPEKNEELWNRFITAKNVFFDRKKQHFESIQSEQEDNYKLKTALVEKAETLKESTDWAATSQAYADILEEWKNIGRVPLEKADEIWARLNAAKDQFFNAKRHHFENVRVTLDDNYAQKVALLKRAEALQNSTHWHEVTAEMNELMDQWKKIGPVPREHSNTIWEQFLTARKHFFNRKDEHREQRKKQIEKNNSMRIHKTRDFLSKLHDEVREEVERITDFKNGLENITPGHKEQELREHLTKLIDQGETRIKRREEKIKEVEKQLEELESKTANKNNEEQETETGQE